MLKCRMVGTTDRGFTLVEVLVSLMAMAIGFVILIGLHYASIRMEMSDQRRGQAIEIARMNLEMLRDPAKWNGATCPSPSTSTQYAAATQYTCTVTPALPSPPPSDTTIQLTVRVEWQERLRMGQGTSAPKQTSRVELTTMFNTSHPFSPS